MSSESSSDTSGSSTSKTSGSTSTSSSTSLHSEDIVEKGSCTSARHRTKRGHAKCKKLEKGGPRRLTFDKNGIAQSPIKHVNEFSSYCGYIARMRVDIRIKDWRKVPTVVKSNLWEDVSKKFVMPRDETHTLNVKKVALKSMSHAWKDFKWKLNINYVKKDKTPFEDYPELKKEWWPDFVEWVTSDEYIALGEKGKQSQSMNKFRQKLGRRSYTVQKRKWAKEDAQALTEGKSIPFQDMPDGRHKDWARARNPSGDVNITESHPIIKKIVDLNEKSVAGTFTPLDNMDILATAIGSNHPGRTTGVSAYVGLGMGLAQGDGPRKKKRRTTKEYVKRIVDEYEAKFEKLTALCQSMERRLNNSESCSSSKFVDTPNHATHHSVDSLQEVMKCKLVVQIGPQSVVVARGQAYPPKDVVTVHGIERRDDHTKVQVDFVFDNFLEFPLPIPIAGGDMFTFGEAKNSFVLWPKSGIQLAEETTVHAKPQQVPDTSPQVLHHTPEKDKMPTPTMGTENIDVTHSASNVSKKRKHKHKKHSKSKEKEQKTSQQKNTEDDGLDPLWTPPFHQRSPPPVPNNKQFVLGQPLLSSALLKRMGKQSQCFHKWYFAMTTPISRRQSATHFMVRYEEHDFLEKSRVYAVEFSDVFHIYNDLALDISLHRSWMLCMRKIDKYRGIVGFLDPEMIILKRINEEADEVEAYIVKALLAQQDKECIFVVCQEGYHWALLVIFPKWNTVYNIDSKGLLVLMSTKKVAITRILVAQLYGNIFSMLCGQYVMYHMLSFADNLSLDHDRYPQGRAGFATCPLLPDEIANVRERLLDFFMNEVIDIGGSCRVEGASYN
ncbi:hypothetical protein ZEAMMB73_Zm00001d015591 [Zea mays]|uniref:DUF8039 domain-containing protein n=1 Tax=Zea mays TaxID=4577 RepID=A0A1D6H2U2_MAIZE|nr:hypothetical protein ZEAMMB73_Zm00001d015591 [Zea mays]